MPRANRHFLPGHVWHITHRCHRKEFLLKFQFQRLSGVGPTQRPEWKEKSRRKAMLRMLRSTFFGPKSRF